jgi:hypothetical protein
MSLISWNSRFVYQAGNGFAIWSNSFCSSRIVCVRFDPAASVAGAEGKLFVDAFQR